MADLQLQWKLLGAGFRRPGECSPLAARSHSGADCFFRWDSHNCQLVLISVSSLKVKLIYPLVRPFIGCLVCGFTDIDPVPNDEMYYRFSTVRCLSSQHPPPTDIHPKAWLSLCALCDTTITCCMVFYLWTARKSTTMEKTTTILTRLIKLTVETGFICTTINLVSLIFLLRSRNTFLYVVFVVVASKLYTNCLFAVSPCFTSYELQRGR